jgi:hypothetical protein
MDSIKVDLKGTVLGCVNRINLAQDRCILQENACKHCVQLSVLFQDDHTHLEMNYETPSSYVQVHVVNVYRVTR